jgi:peptide/nickel transport system ATP-binding protein
MTNDPRTAGTGEILLEMRDIRIDGFSDESWHDIIKGVDLTLSRGEVMGLIGESGAGKSTLGKAAMGYTQPGCRLTGGSILFDGIDLVKASDTEKRSSGAPASPMWRNRQRPPSIPPTG